MKNSEMLNNLYKILRMNIVLANNNGEIVSEDTIQNFDETAKKIDESSINDYEDKIKDMYYATKSLDEEAERLDKLISLIDGKIDERKELMYDFHEVTGRVLEPLGYIRDEEKVESYRIRLNDIKTYLSNKENIAKIEEELILLDKELDECFSSKKKDEENNSNLESELLSVFKSSVSGTDYFKVINVVDVDLELEKLRPDVNERFKTLSTFENAYNNLLRAGISRDSENEYAGYVLDAKKNYYEVKEKEYLYQIYKIILDSKNVYSELYDKRDKLDNVLEERLKLRVDMSIRDDDILTPLYDVIDKQNKDIVKEKEVIDKTIELEDTIKFKKMRLNELIDDNKRVEILSLLEEFGIIDTYKSDIDLDVDSKDDNQINLENEDNSSDNSVVDVAIPNMVVDIKDAYLSLNVGFARSKADTVMRRVGRSLGYSPEPKKENIVTFDYSNKDESKQEEAVNNNDVKEEEKVVNNSLSSLNLDDLNLKLNLDNKDSNDEVINNDVNYVNPIFPNIMPNDNINDLDKDVDKDFWSAEEDKAIFPSALVDNNYSLNKNESGFKLQNPVNIGGYDENRN